ncbi:threonine ammonia-lyase [Pontivivens nitratireducens]|uniref:Pyridoxal-phosphate dependent enzyme n=1 Tax=Pontivivens nitratireducens TaxID=2758038 RepID=A0A6G7VIX2_9RHOB|nr:pyridoxal-phosphate dependent enzyme [Pontibrevibacter nitratireducens]QIK39840.1 pyridoxal-phosphate dependent enzyme [Pontibrevibacter nitratireducens]
MPDLNEIDAAAKRLRGRIVATPILPLTTDRLSDVLPEGAQVFMKMELFQQAGSFKSRGVLLGIDTMTDAQRAAGVIASSGGNHALAVAWAANAAGIDALIIMPEAADPQTVARVADLGATIERTSGSATNLAYLDEKTAQTGRTKLHPFEAPHMLLGAATCGYEIVCALPDLDAVIVPVGGGGLIAGVSRAVKLFSPACQVIGVEPVGAAGMTRSVEAGSPQTLDSVQTVAVSLAASRAEPLTFSAVQAHVDRMLTLPDSELIAAMRRFNTDLSLMVEPACAASFAALTGPLRAELAGKRVAVIACGSNIGRAGHARILDAD